MEFPTGQFAAGRYYISPKIGEISVVIPNVIPNTLDQIRPEYTEGYTDHLEISGFTPYSADHEWGFGNNMRTVDEGDGFRRHILTLPKTTDRRNWREQETNALYEASASIGTVINYLEIQDIDVSPLPELAQISLTTWIGSQGGVIAAHTFPAFHHWIFENLGRDNSDAVEMMKGEFYYLFGKEFRFSDDMFQADFEDPKWIYLQCFGDACDLGVDGGDKDDTDLDTVARLSPHNSDGPVQQLTLLSGFGTFMEAAATYYLGRS